MNSPSVKHCDACGAYIGYRADLIHEHPCSAYRTEPDMPAATFDHSPARYRNTEDGLARFRRGSK